MVNEIHISDESGDRKYFTIIPNYILNHSTMWDREVYVQMKRVAGERGSCWVSRKSLARQCGMSVRRLDQSLRYLITHEWIEFKSKKKILTVGGEQSVNEYRICDLWRKNVDFYEAIKGGALRATPATKGGAPDDTKVVHGSTKGGAGGAHKEELYIKTKEEEPKRCFCENVNTLKEEELKKLCDAIITSMIKVDARNVNYFKSKSQRAACAFMIQVYGFDTVHIVSSQLPTTNKREFYPVITSPCELRDKWVKWERAHMRYGRKESVVSARSELAKRKKI